MKKYRVASITLLFVCICNLAISENIKLSEALKKKMISLNFRSIDKTSVSSPSSHNGACVKMTIKNLCSRPISVEVEPGQFLIQNDTSTQRMIIIDNSIFQMTANSTRISNINALCSQMHKKSPQMDLAYIPKNKAEGSLLELAKLLATNKFSGYAAQNAVWAITDNNRIESIYSENANETDVLRKFVAKAKNIPLPAEKKPEKINFKNTKGVLKLSFDNNNGGKYDIKLYNSLGEMVQQFDKEEVYPKYDLITINIRFESSLAAGTYYVRLIRNGNEIIQNLPVIVD